MQANIVAAFYHKFTATKKGSEKKKQSLKKTGKFEKRGISVVILKKVAANTIRVIFEIFELYKQVIYRLVDLELLYQMVTCLYEG